MKRVYLFVLCLTLLAPLRAMEFPFKRLEVNDGLSNNAITAICKDSRGFVWIGTRLGLNRYDGYTIKTYYYSYDDDDYISSIQEDAEGRLWIQAGAGYTLYDPATDAFDRNMEALVRQWGVEGEPRLVCIDRDHTLWMLVEEKGICCLKRGAEHAEWVKGSEALAAKGRVNRMAACEEGLLIVERRGELSCIDRETLAVGGTNTDIAREKQLEWSQNFSLFVDEVNREVWVYDVSGTYVCELPLQEGKMRKWQLDENDFVCSITQDNRGRIWIGTDQNGIEVVETSGNRSSVVHDPANPYSIPHNTVHALYTDDDGTVWVGTYKKGLAYYHESTFKFSRDNVGDVLTILEDDDQSLWLGTNGEGLIHWNRQTGEKRHFRYGNTEQSLPADAVVCLLKDSRGRLWAGTFRGGLSCYEKGRFTHYLADGGENSLANENAWTLTEDSEGNIWIGTWGGGLQCLNPQTGTFTTYTTGLNSALGSTQISSLCIMQNQYLLIGTTYGTSVMDLRTRTLSRLEGEKWGLPAFSTNVANQIYEDSRNLVWFACDDGMYIYNYRQERLSRVELPEELAHQGMVGITEDEEHTMWVTANNRLVNIVPMVNAKTGELTFQYHLFDSKDGLLDCDFNVRTLVRLSSGEMVAGGLLGVNRFHPVRMPYNQAMPRVMFTDMQLFNEPVRVGDEYDGHVILEQSLNEAEKVELKYDQNVFTVFFASDNYVHPEKMRYSYYLEGFADLWLETAPGVHSLTYTNLAPGEYTLCVKATNSDGFQGTEEARLRLVILPPFWRSTWAYLLYASGVLGLIVLAYLAVRRRENNRFRHLQQEEDIRKQEELNQLKFRFFTNVSHELRTPLTLIITPLEGILKEMEETPLKGKLELMHRNALRLLNLVNQLLDFRKNEMAVLHLSLSEGDIVAYLRSICNSFLLLSERKKIHLTFYSAIECLYMPFDEDKMGKVLMNLLSNAFKYTPDGGRVDVAVEVPAERTDRLQIRVADTGMGISDEEKEHVFDRFYQVQKESKHQVFTGSGIGLNLVRDFVTLHGGTVSVVDNVGGRGCVFVVEIPIGEMEKEGADELPPEEEGLPGMTGEETPEPDEEERQKPLALLVDDNEDLLAFMCDSLKLHFRIASATNGRAALNEMKREQPDIIVCDVMMPEMDGNEFCSRVKENPDTTDIPVILLTAKHSVDAKVEGLSQGADDYITKPFNLEILTLRMQKLISLSRKKRTDKTISLEPTPIAITSMDEQLIERAIHYVEKNIDDPELSVEGLSQELGMSRANLYKKLQQIADKTPTEFIRLIRLRRGAQLLRESQKNVSEIAYLVGFSSPKYFSKYFREEFGMLPSAYQQKEGKAEVKWNHFS